MKEKFKELIDQYITSTETIFLAKLDASDNKDYAEALYRKEVFENHPKLPVGTFFYQLLSIEFLNTYMLKRDSALELIIKRIPSIQERVRSHIDELLEDAFLSGGSDYDDVIREEERLLTLNEVELIEILACLVAMKKLLEKYPNEAGIEIGDVNTPVNDKATLKKLKGENAKINFTEKEQVVALYFLCIQLGILPHELNKSAFARFAHLITGKSIKKSETNEQKYKLIKHLLDFRKGGIELKILKKMRPYFRDMGFNRALEEIQREINGFEDDI